MREAKERHLKQLETVLPQHPPEHQKAILDAAFESVRRKSERIKHESVVKAEERKIDNWIKRFDTFIKESDLVGNMLQFSRVAIVVAAGIELGNNLAYNEASNILTVISAAGFLVNMYRNKDKNLRKLAKHEHNAKRKAESEVESLESVLKRELRHSYDDARVAAQWLTVHYHRKQNGNNNSGE